MKPLENIKIIDFTITHGGPIATMLLAAFGAEVIKVEPVGGQDPARKFPPFNEKGYSGYYAYLNRGKKGISVDITKSAGREVIKKMVADADVIVQNYKDDYLAKNGLDFETLKKSNPKIVYATLTGYGKDSPRKGMAALEVQLQSMCGISSISGYEDGAPVRAGAEVACHVGGTYLATAIMLALTHAYKTGEGQQIDIAILDSIFAIIEGAAIEYTLLGLKRKRTGNSYPSICPYDTFTTKNGSVSIGVSTDRQWKLFCDAFDFKELSKDPRYITNEDRGINYWTGMRDILQDKLNQYTKEEVAELMNANKIPCGIIKTVSEAIESEQVAERNMIFSMDDFNIGKIDMPGVPIKILGINELEFIPAPIHGQDTESYLASIGFCEKEINNLKQNRVIEGKQLYGEGL